MSSVEIDLFGNEVPIDVLLRDTFIEPPFSVLDTKSGSWQSRKRAWKEIGMKSEVGRDATTFNTKDWADENNNKGDIIPSDTSIFDPALCEVMYHWFCPDNGTILDPFAGGSVRGIVANYLGYKYTGIELREEQVLSNREQSDVILNGKEQPLWIVGDADEQLDHLQDTYDFVFSCPPYGDLEVYSDLPEDLSNMSYQDFLVKYYSIIDKSCRKLCEGGYAVFVVGEFRDKKGNYVGFVPDTIRAFQECGMKYYNEAILLNAIVTAALRAGGNMKSQKLVKVHQNVLCFKKI